MSNDQIAQMRAEVEYLDAELRSIHEGAEERSLSDEETQRWNDGVWLRHALIAQGIDHEARSNVLATAAIPARTETGDGPAGGGLQIQRDADPFEGLDEVRFNRGNPRRGDELRSRAAKVIERSEHFELDEHREHATNLVRSSSPDVAEFILERATDAHAEAFRAVMANPMNPGLALAGASPEAQRAALSLTGANGGYLIPPHLDPTIILTNNGATNPFREISTIKTITTNQWNGVTSAGVTAEWVAEATQVADASPTFAQAPIPVHKADAYVQASLEVMQDTGVTSELSMLIADAKDRLEAAAFATGSGSGQPTGIVTALGLVTASRVAGSSGAAGAADFVVGDVYNLAQALPPRHRPGSSWLAENATYIDIRQFGTSNTYHAFWTDLGPATPSQLLGRPTYESSAMDSTVVSGSNDDVLILGDFRKYFIVDRMGLELVYEPLVKGANQRPTGESGWVAFWRVGGNTVDPNAYRMLRL